MRWWREAGERINEVTRRTRVESLTSTYIHTSSSLAHFPLVMATTALGTLYSQLQQAFASSDLHQTGQLLAKLKVTAKAAYAIF